MTELPDRCEPCTGDTPAFSEAEARAHSADCPAWDLDLETPALRRRFRPKDFRAALAWINRVGMLAEEENHHPDIHLTGWNRVEFVIATHAIGGLSLPDLVLAAKMDAIPVEYSPKWLKEQQAAQQQHAQQ